MPHRAARKFALSQYALQTHFICSHSPCYLDTDTIHTLMEATHQNRGMRWHTYEHYQVATTPHTYVA